MKPEVEALVRKSRRSIAAARRLSEQGDHDFAASRAYFAMFYLAEALLLARGLAFSKHSAVIAAFGQHFVKTGKFSPDHHAALRKAFDERNVGDYDYLGSISVETAAELLKNAESFANVAEAYLRGTETSRP